MFKLLKSITVAVIAAAFSVTMLIQPASAASWTAPINLSSSGKYATVPSIALSNNGKIHTVWTEWTIDEQGFLVDFELFYAKSTDNGSTFSAPVNISNSPNNFSGEPVVAIAGDQSNEIHVTWEEYDTTGSGTEVFYTRSTDEGVTWPSSNKRNVSNAEGSSGSPHLFVDSTASHAVHIAWTDYLTNGYGQIHYSKSTDGGSAFSPPLIVAANGRDSDQPTVIADSTAVHVAWQDNEVAQIFHARSTNGGTSFSAAEQRSSSASTITAVEPAMTFDGQNRVHIVWTRFNDQGGSDISWAVSQDNGATFAASQNRTGTPTTVSQAPTISSPGGGRVVIIWTESNPDGTVQNHYMNSPNGGASWQSTEAVGGSATYANEPSILVKGSTLYLVWEDAGVVKFSKGS